MVRFILGAVFGSLLIGGFPNNALAGRFLPNECPKNKALLEIEIPNISSSGEHCSLAAVVLKGDGLESEKYLHTRSDGWTHISSEKKLFKEGQAVSNCSPGGNYTIHVEYYRPKDMALTNLLEISAIIEEAAVAEVDFYEEIDFPPGVLIVRFDDGKWSKPDILDYRSPYAFWISVSVAVVLIPVIIWCFLTKAGSNQNRGD